MRQLHEAVIAMMLLAHRCVGFVPIGAAVRSRLCTSSKLRMTNGSSLSLPALRRRDVFTVAGAAALGPLAWLQKSAKSSAAAPSILCDDAVSHLTVNGRNVYIVGTAHISEKSASLVKGVIRYVRPEVVMIELDRSRLPMLTKEGPPGPAGSPTSTSMASPPEPQQQQQPPQKQDAPGILNRIMSKILPNGFGSQGGPSFVTALTAAGAGRVISGLYKYLNGIGFESGGEFVAAVETAREVGARVLLGDRPVNVTLNHLADAIRATGVRKLLTVQLMPEDVDAGLLDGMDSPSSKESIEAMMELMKKRDTVDKLMTAVQRELPLVYTAMVAERDAYMAEAVAQYLKQTGMKDCCMVVGMAHMSGIERNLKLKYGFSAAAPACELVAQPA